MSDDHPVTTIPSGQAIRRARADLMAPAYRRPVDSRAGHHSEVRHLDEAQALFVEHGAKLYLDQVIAKKLELQGVGADSDVTTSIDAVATSVGRERPDLATHAAPDGTGWLLERSSLHAATVTTTLPLTWPSST